MVTANRSRILSPLERFSEVTFGLLMMLTFTGALSVVQADKKEISTMLLGALGCNLAWGLIDAVFYIVNSFAERLHRAKLMARMRAAGENISDDDLADLFGFEIRGSIDADFRQKISTKLQSLPPPQNLRICDKETLRSSLAVFLLVTFSMFPVALPFLIFQDAERALRISNLVAVVLLFGVGFRLGHYAGKSPILTGILSTLVGAALVSITIALGG